jgi:hypothetical protein
LPHGWHPTAFCTLEKLRLEAGIMLPELKLLVRKLPEPPPPPLNVEFAQLPQDIFPPFPFSFSPQQPKRASKRTLGTNGILSFIFFIIFLFLFLFCFFCFFVFLRFPFHATMMVKANPILLLLQS